MSDQHLPRGPLVILGTLTIVAFGVWLYGFGVLVEPIREDTGWGESTITIAYGASLLLTGIGAAFTGKVLDTRGSRVMFGVSGVLAFVLLNATSYAPNAWVFLPLATLTGGVIGAAGYYHASQAVMARLVPEQRARAITVLTLYGAFASTVFLPLMAWLAQSVGWRSTLRIVAVIVLVAFLAAAFGIRDVRPDVPAAHGIRRSMVIAWGVPLVRAMFLAGFLAGAASSTLVLYQVPAMTDAGLALGVASAFAGARGFAQLGGRLPLPWIIERLGAGPTVRWSYLLTAVGALLLTNAGSYLTAAAFTLVAGVAIGALAAAEGIYASEIIDPATIGTTLGLFSLMRGLGSAIGPSLAGITVDLTGSRTVALVAAAAAVTLGSFLLPKRRAVETPAAH